MEVLSVIIPQRIRTSNTQLQPVGAPRARVVALTGATHTTGCRGPLSPWVWGHQHITSPGGGLHVLLLFFPPRSPGTPPTSVLPTAHGSIWSCSHHSFPTRELSTDPHGGRLPPGIAESPGGFLQHPKDNTRAKARQLGGWDLPPVPSSRGLFWDISDAGRGGTGSFSWASAVSGLCHPCPETRALGCTVDVSWVGLPAGRAADSIGATPVHTFIGLT